VALLIREHNLPRDIALDNLVSEIPPHRVAANRIDLKTLLQRQPASFKPDVHQSRAGEVTVREYLSHPISLPAGFSVGCCR